MTPLNDEGGKRFGSRPFVPKAPGWIPDECHGGLDKMDGLFRQRRVHEVKLKNSVMVMMVSFIIIISFICLKYFSILIIYEIYRHADMPVVFMVNMIDDGDGDDANESN